MNKKIIVHSFFSRVNQTHFWMLTNKYLSLGILVVSVIFVTLRLWSWHLPTGGSTKEGKIPLILLERWKCQMGAGGHPDLACLPELWGFCNLKLGLGSPWVCLWEAVDGIYLSRGSFSPPLPLSSDMGGKDLCFSQNVSVGGELVAVWESRCLAFFVL